MFKDVETVLICYDLLCLLEDEAPYVYKRCISVILWLKHLRKMSKDVPQARRAHVEDTAFDRPGSILFVVQLPDLF